ncbi:5288_t:CDS:1, partial [Acaulospora colombiana]
TRDGFNPQTFWDKCHGHANTVLVLRVEGTGEIIGGYNPVAWDKRTGGT